MEFPKFNIKIMPIQSRPFSKEDHKNIAKINLDQYQNSKKKYSKNKFWKYFGNFGKFRKK